ncbi:MAG TPA: HEAT repeat domain-containing protein, partial [Verrucomicrobiae bacterium]
MADRKKKRPPGAAKHASPPATPARGAKIIWLAAAAAVVIIAGALAWRLAHPQRYGSGPSNPKSRAKAFTLEPEEKVFAAYAGSQSCKECHSVAFEKWRESHHGLAERGVDPKLDRAAFDPPRAIKHGAQTSEARTSNEEPQLVTLGLDGKKAPFQPDRVIGVDPLLQYLIPAERGRWQTAELTWDPHKQEWFDVFGNEDRQPGEWGHWTGRGMTWNQMCAACHNTRVRKDYAPATDTYRTRMAEMSVGCESCHGPMRAHNEWQKKYPGQRGDPTVKKFTHRQVIDTCGTCHSRRGELTGDFVPGDNYFDHFTLTIPDESDVFYPDGQVRDEDYEFTSFLGSKMYGAGVRCVDCHDPHNAKTILASAVLCMKCHIAPTPEFPKAPIIVPATHTFHKPESTGSECVNCHMPQTTYMQRHPRHDHGFTTPDPLLTKQHNIPNACSRCHADKSADWALEACVKWYGPKMERPTRTRAQSIAQARANTPGAHINLLRMLTDEPLPLWRAVAANLLRNFTREPGVVAALTRVTKDTNELVRAMAARALEQPAQQCDPAAIDVLEVLLDDPVRAVRVDAAWSFRARIVTNSTAGSELVHSLTLNRDQPLGLLQWGNFLADRGDRAGALAAFRQAVEWDKGSPPLRHA